MVVGLDTETELVTESSPVPRLVSVAIQTETENSLYLHSDPELPMVLERLLTSKQHLAIANAPFDVSVLCEKFPQLWPLFLELYREGYIFDILTVEKLIDIAEGEFRKRGAYDLGSVAERRTNMEVDKEEEWRTRYSELYDLPVALWPKEAEDYARKDPLAARKTALQQIEYLKKHPGLVSKRDRINQAKAHMALYSMSTRGLATDQTRVEVLAEVMQRELERLADILLQNGLMRREGKAKPKLVKKKKAAQQMLLSYLQETKQEIFFTEKGQVSLEKEALSNYRFDVEGDQRQSKPRPFCEVCKGSGYAPLAFLSCYLCFPEHPLEAFRKHGSLSTLFTKNIPVLRAPIVRTRYHELMNTGRTSSRKAKAYPSTNLQNFPKIGGFRECLVPRPGFCFVISDYRMAELVALAQVQLILFGESKLAEVLRQGRDPHAEMAVVLLGVSEYDGSNPEHKQARQISKALNFGYPGGLGPNRFIDFAKTYGLEISLTLARKLKEVWLRQWPDMKRYFDWVSKCQKNGTFEMRHMWSGRVRGGCLYTEACNTMFQGLAADGAKVALWNLFEACQKPDHLFYRAEAAPVLFVHDENVLEVRTDFALEAKQEQERIMIESFAVVCPDVPIGVESYIANCYRKD